MSEVVLSFVISATAGTLSGVASQLIYNWLKDRYGNKDTEGGKTEN